MMNEQTYAAMISEMSQQIANLSVDRSEFKARLAEALQELAQYRSVLEADQDLKELFNETQEKLQKQVTEEQ